MTSFSYYLDTRRPNADGLFPLRMYFFHNKSGAYVRTGIHLKISQWNSDTNKVIHHPFAQQYNLMLEQMHAQLQLKAANMIADLSINRYKATELRAIFDELLFGPDDQDEEKDDKKNEQPTIVSVWTKHITEAVADCTKKAHRVGLKAFCKYSPKSFDLTFDDIDKDFVKSYFRYLISTGLNNNTAVLYVRHLRTIFNAAIDDGITQNYPFRKLRLKNLPTRKRNLSVEQLRAVMLSKVPEEHVFAQDLFKLYFLLIGINTKDMYGLIKVNNGRIEYLRSKTKKAYSILLQPEAKEILLKYKGNRKLLNFCEGNYTTFVQGSLDKIRALGKYVLGEDWMLSPYWSRHSWASIASELDIPIETISAGLGHNYGSSTTTTYINFNLKKVDAANRRIIDYVFYKES